MAVLKYKDQTGKFICIPAIQGPAGGVVDVAQSATPGYLTVTNSDGTTEEISVCLGHGGGGEGSGVSEIIVNVSEPASTDIKLWIDPDTGAGLMKYRGTDNAFSVMPGVFSVTESATKGYITVKNNDGTISEVPVGDPNALIKTGDTMTGALNMNGAVITYKTAENVPMARFGISATNQLRFWEFNSAGTNYEYYNLPAPDLSRTSNQEYKILTNKQAVSVAEGGTGATTAAQAAINLNVLPLTGGTITGDLNVTGKVTGAVWNDYAEYRSAEVIEPGRVVVEDNDGIMKLAAHRLQPGAEIISDTFGFSIGESKDCRTPIACSGRVLAYTYEDRNEFQLGEAVCSGPNGTVSRMTREEIRNYPERIIGTVSEVPSYETWGTGDVKVNGRIWIRIK